MYLCLEEFITSFSLPPEGERLRVFGNLGDLFRSLAELYSPLRKKAKQRMTDFHTETVAWNKRENGKSKAAGIFFRKLSSCSEVMATVGN